MPFLSSKSAQIYYESVGAGDPIVLIHGTGIAGQAWRPQIEALQKDFQVIWFDNRGVGQSQINAEGVSLDAMLSDTAAVLAHLGLSSAHFVGHSLGGIVAHQFAVRHPEKVKSLALLCSFPTGQNVVELRAKMFAVSMRTFIGTKAMRRHAFLEMVTSPTRIKSQGAESLIAQLTECFGRKLEDQPSVAFKQLQAMAKHRDAGDFSVLRDTPALIVSGADDVVAPPKFGRALLELLPQAKYVELAGEGHAVVIHNSKMINELLLAHLKQGLAASRD